MPVLDDVFDKYSESKRVPSANYMRCQPLAREERNSTKEEFFSDSKSGAERVAVTIETEVSSWKMQAPAASTLGLQHVSTPSSHGGQDDRIGCVALRFNSHGLSPLLPLLPVRRSALFLVILLSYLRSTSTIHTRCASLSTSLSMPWLNG